MTDNDAIVAVALAGLAANKLMELSDLLSDARPDLLKNLSNEVIVSACVIATWAAIHDDDKHLEFVKLLRDSLSLEILTNGRATIDDIDYGKGEVK